jgi:hypothetical protein
MTSIYVMLSRYCDVGYVFVSPGKMAWFCDVDVRDACDVVRALLTVKSVVSMISFKTVTSVGDIVTVMFARNTMALMAAMS